MHRPTIVTEIREVPSKNSWAAYKPTGRACVVCPCGLNTGFIASHAAGRTLANHVHPRQTIEIHLRPTDLATSITDAIRRAHRRS